MASQREVERPRDLMRLSDQDFTYGYTAIANRQAIIEGGRMFLQTLGDRVEQESAHTRAIAEVLKAQGDQVQEGEISASLRNTILAKLRSIKDTVETVLEYVERSAKDVMQKQETVLRGFFNLTDLGGQASFFALLDFANDFLDIREEAFAAEQRFISESQKYIEEQKMSILQKVEEAGDLLKAIINDNNIDHRKGLQFDNVVREADVAISACKRHLVGINETTMKLESKMQTIKWFSRLTRLTGCALATWYLYKKFDEGSIGFPKFALSTGVVTVALFSIFPSRMYKLHDSLMLMQSDHSALTTHLDNIREKLQSTKDYKDGIMKNAGAPV